MNKPSANTAKLRARQLKPGMEALGVVLSFLCRESPFADFRAGRLVAAVQHQLSGGCHLCLIEEERLVGYAGWLPISAADGENWLRGRAELKPLPPAEADAVALTILSAARPEYTLPLIRLCRKLAHHEAIFFKRDYGGGRMRKTRMKIGRQRGRYDA